MQYVLQWVEPVSEETWKPDSMTGVVMGPRLTGGGLLPCAFSLVLYMYYCSQIFPRVNLLLTSEISSSTN